MSAAMSVTTSTASNAIAIDSKVACKEKDAKEKFQITPEFEEEAIISLYKEQNGKMVSIETGHDTGLTREQLTKITKAAVAIPRNKVLTHGSIEIDKSVYKFCRTTHKDVEIFKEKDEASKDYQYNVTKIFSISQARFVVSKIVNFIHEAHLKSHYKRLAILKQLHDKVGFADGITPAGNFASFSTVSEYSSKTYEQVVNIQKLALCDLSKAIENKMFAGKTVKQKLTYARQLLFGLTHMVRYCVIHKDIALRNIFVFQGNADYSLRLADFDGCKLVKDFGNLKADITADNISSWSEMSSYSGATFSQHDTGPSGDFATSVQNYNKTMLRGIGRSIIYLLTDNYIGLNEAPKDILKPFLQKCCKESWYFRMFGYPNRLEKLLLSMIDLHRENMPTPEQALNEFDAILKAL